MGRRQTQSMCMGKGDTERLCVNFRTAETKQPRRKERNHSERTQGLGQGQGQETQARTEERVTDRDTQTDSGGGR